MTAPLHPSDLGLILSYQCQCACAHCLYNCGPGWNEWMEPPEIEAALEATQYWDHPYQVHITGGEPFLKPDALLHAVETAARLDIPRYVETNAGWCVRESLVEERFEALREAGLDAILISCSPFHAETIPPDRTNLAIRKAMEIFGPGRVIVYLPDYLTLVNSMSSEQPVPLSSYEEQFGFPQARRILWDGYGIISGGRSGYRLGAYARHYPADHFMDMDCRRDILHAHHSHFDLYGNYISGFCGGLSIGTWRSLPDLTERVRHSSFPQLIGILIESGPFGLMSFAEKEYGYRQGTQGYTGKCHLCVDVRQHLIRSHPFAELTPEAFYKNL